jgi:hypothetical protein
MKSLYAADLAPEQVFEEANRLLASDRARLGLTNYPQYRGQSISPMSTLTQRARALQSGFNAKPAPYSGKINAVLARPNQVSPLGAQGQIDQLAKNQQTFNRNKLASVLQEQFRESYNPQRFLDKKAPKDLGRGLPEISGNFGDITRSANALEQSSNQALIDKLRDLQAQKQDRRNTLVGTLEQFGAQKHGYNNLANSINRNAFEQEANAPFKRMEMLQQSLNPLSQSMGDNVLPEIKAQAAKEALQALRAYGVDTNKPVSEWGAARTGGGSYPGKLIADLPPEILASHNTLEGLSPKFQGSQHGQSKALLNELLAGEGVGDRALKNVPTRLSPQVENLESAAQKRFKRDLALINNQFIQANQYGSGLHRKAAEDRAREISQATLEQRGRLLNDTAISELALGHQDQQAKLRQLGLYGDQAQNEYQNLLGAIRSTNQLGATKFGNEQAENEDLYKNYQNEAGWEWPHLRGTISKEARTQAFGDIFGKPSVNRLAEANTGYSELEKEAQTARAELQTLRNAQNELQRQLGIQQNAQRQAQTQADAQRKQQEAQRLAQQQQAAAEAHVQAQADFNRKNRPEYLAVKGILDNLSKQSGFALKGNPYNDESYESAIRGMQAQGWRFVNGQWVK